MHEATIRHIELELLNIPHVIDVSIENGAGELSVNVRSNSTSPEFEATIDILKVLNHNVPTGIKLNLKVERTMLAKVTSKLKKLWGNINV